MKKYTRLVYAARMRAGVSIAELAKLLGKAKSTLYNELRPNFDPAATAKLGLDDAAIIMKFLRDYSLAKALAEDVGFTCLPESCPVPNGHSIHEEMVHDHVAHAEFCRAIEEGASVDEIASLARRAIREIEETLALYHRVRHQAQGLAGGGAAPKTGGEWPA